ncbi:hypothetical protein ACOJIV_23825, partial [Haloarcula sp. AONF1]
MDDNFDGIEFSGSKGEREPHEFIETAHDPDVLYYTIKNAEAKLNEGVVVDTDGKDATVAVHEKVDLFQSVIQYVEAFSVYYLSYLKDQEKLAQHLTSIDPKEVKRFYRKLQRGREGEYLANNNIRTGYRELLETRFGYQYVRDSVEAGEAKPKEIIPDGSPYETVEELIENSADRIDNDIRRLGKFYRDFSDLYNAVKHGNRVIPQAEGQYGVASNRGDAENVTSELTYEAAMFLCRGSGKQDDYFAIVPTDYLLNQSLSIAETTHDLFSYLRDIAKVGIEEEWEFSVPLHQPTKKPRNGSKDAKEWAMIRNENTVSIVPKSDELSQLIPGDEEASWSFAATLDKDGNAMVIRSRGDVETSQEYPILVTMRRSSNDLSPAPSSAVSIDIDIGRLNVQQYLDLLELKDAVEAGKVRKGILYSEMRDEGIPMGPLTSALNLSSLPELIDREYLEELAILQRITDPQIPVPQHLFESDKETIEKWKSSRRNTEAAEEAVASLGKWSEREVTIIHADLVNIFNQEITSRRIGAIPGKINTDLEFKTDEGKEWFEENWGQNEALQLPADGYDGSYEELVEQLTEDIADGAPFLE